MARLLIDRVANGYTVEPLPSSYTDPKLDEELYVFETFGALVRHLGGEFNEPHTIEVIHASFVFQRVADPPHLEFIEVEDQDGKGIRVGEWTGGRSEDEQVLMVDVVRYLDPPEKDEDDAPQLG